MRIAFNLLLTITLISFMSCAKESQPTDLAAEEQVQGEATTYEFDLPPSAVEDRVPATHGLIISSITLPPGGFTYSFVVRRQSDNAIVWQAGGWHGTTQAIWLQKTLDNELTYRASLTMSPAYGYGTGNVSWRLYRTTFGCSVLGTRAIPSSGALADPWNPCQ